MAPTSHFLAKNPGVVIGKNDDEKVVVLSVLFFRIAEQRAVVANTLLARCR
jgi:hypothetical protein